MIIGLRKFKIVAMDQLYHFCGCKNYLGKNYLNFTIAFPTIWRFAGDFCKVLLKYKMVAMDELNNVLWAQKLKSEIIQILHITHHLEMCR